MTNSALYNRIMKGGIKGHSAPKIYNYMMGGKKGGAVNGSAFLQLLNSKKEFLIAVFANLIAQLGITYYVMTNYKGPDKNNLMFWGLFVVEILIIFALALIPMPSWLKFILFSMFSVCWGIMLSFMKKIVDSKVIQMAILGTLSIFGVMFLFGATLIMFGVNLGLQFAAFLFYALLLLIIFQIVTLFSSGSMKFIYILSLVLFSLYIIYDTNNILQRDYNGDFITASLDYYLDILNIFIDLIGIFGNSN